MVYSVVMLRSGLCVEVCVSGPVDKPTFIGLTYANDRARLGSSVVKSRTLLKEASRNQAVCLG
jgi:hypothetical protein